MTRPIRILGIDPGLRRTGWGAICCEGNRLSFLGSGTVTSNDTGWPKGCWSCMAAWRGC